MPASSSKRKRLQARTSVTSRASPMDSPNWKPASEFLFIDLKSPSPTKRTTRRSSVYRKATTKRVSDATKFKMPVQKMKSPPGIKTRARRSSIYQKGGQQLTSPPSSRTRRRSMYVSARPSLPITSEFSKVWATPVKTIEPIIEASSKAAKASGQSTSANIARSPSPVKKGVEKSPAKPTFKTPVNKMKKTPKKTTGKKNKQLESKTKKTPAKVVADLETQEMEEKSPQQVKSVKKTPANKKNQTPANKKSPSAMKASASKSHKTSIKKSSPSRKNNKEIILTSTPSKSVEEISGKSFYSTPKSTPIPQQRQDEVFVFSAKQTKSTKKSSVKRATIISPKNTPANKPMKKPIKTPHPVSSKKKRPREDTPSSPVAKRPKTSPKPRTLRSAKRPVKSTPKSQSPDSKKKILSPSEMTSILKDVEQVEQVEKRKASLSPSPRPRKLARLAEAATLSTPRVTKSAKRVSPKKLAEFQDRNQSFSAANVTLLDETINTDSRSGRCTIL